MRPKADQSQLADSPNPKNTPPLFVDLDGTLIPGDTLWESFALLLRQNPVAAFSVLLTLLRGRGAFKRAVVEKIVFSPLSLKFNDVVVSFVKNEAKKGRLTVLATAADNAIASAVASHLGCFDHVMASDGTCNLKGSEKLETIIAYAKETTGETAFDYIGDNRADRPIWRAAKNAIVVAGNETTAKQVTGPDIIADFLPGQQKSWHDFFKAMRVHQWAKNALIFAPLLLSHTYTQLDKVLDALIGFACFGLCASATYLWNDILDLPADRAHPRKKKRPLASGRIGIPESLVFSTGILLLSIGTAWMLLPPTAILFLCGYIVLTLGYSFFLKEKLLVDAMMLGWLFSYRILFGGVVTGVAVSDWLIAFSIFFFLGLALVKRYSEVSLKAPNQTGKISGRGYYASDREVIGVLGIASSFMAILILALYITSPAVVVLYEQPQALWGVCFVMIYWISRIWVLCHRGHMPDDPIVFALKDKISIMAGMLCVVLVLVAKL